MTAASHQSTNWHKGRSVFMLAANKKTQLQYVAYRPLAENLLAGYDWSEFMENDIFLF